SICWDTAGRKECLVVSANRARVENGPTLQSQSHLILQRGGKGRGISRDLVRSWPLCVPNARDPPALREGSPKPLAANRTALFHETKASSRKAADWKLPGQIRRGYRPRVLVVLRRMSRSVWSARSLLPLSHEPRLPTLKNIRESIAS